MPDETDEPEEHQEQDEQDASPITAADVGDFNRKLVEEFRANGGKLSGAFGQVPMLLLTTTGRKSGRRHTTPLAYRPEGDAIYVFGSFAGGPRHPAWYHNLVANPDVTVEVGPETFEGTAVVLDGAERDAVFERQKADIQQFAEYEARTTRVIPVVRLDRKPSEGARA
ncbi:MAG TPA: nitroreductase family deazaflavin-dependent oxidoreductase [Acidimicrobiia bacterium]|nr:nitroreductase family deazaflavin-dependent oxidoreductase [Acidimicrobiia bacterium]